MPKIDLTLLRKSQRRRSRRAVASTRDAWCWQQKAMDRFRNTHRRSCEFLTARICFRACSALLAIAGRVMFPGTNRAMKRSTKRHEQNTGVAVYQPISTMLSSTAKKEHCTTQKQISWNKRKTWLSRARYCYLQQGSPTFSIPRDTP